MCCSVEFMALRHSLAILWLSFQIYKLKFACFYFLQIKMFLIPREASDALWLQD